MKIFVTVDMDHFLVPEVLEKNENFWDIGNRILIMVCILRVMELYASFQII